MNQTTEEDFETHGDGSEQCLDKRQMACMLSEKCNWCETEMSQVAT